jgi:exopolysaccharide biosynthesis predicted pyruvyltransferase EpsI/glycosyltransferase involved in cell wall biosynthesis
MENKDAKVSVIMSIYNAERHMCESLESALNQTLNEIEIVCVYKASNDNTLTLLNEYAVKDDRIRILEQTGTRGCGPAKNQGMLSAKGEYITFLDADDYYSSMDCLEKIYNAAKKNNVKVCGAFRSLLHIDGSLEPHLLHRKALKGKHNGVLLDYAEYQFDYHFHSYLYERKMILEQEFTFNTTLTYDDPHFFVRLMHYNKYFYIVPVEMYCYRLFEGSYGRWNLEQTVDSARAFIDILRFSDKEKLAILHWKTVRRMESGDYCNNFKRFISDDELYKLLQEANSLINVQLIKEVQNNMPVIGILDTQDISWDKLELNSDGTYTLSSLLLPRQLNLSSYSPVKPVKREAANNVKVTVVVPVFNVASYLRECIDSILTQTLEDIEVICADGGSKDGSLEILNEYEEFDGRVKIISKDGSGYGQSVNEAMDMAKGKYIGLVESDDAIAPKMYETLYSFAEEHNLDWVRSDYYYYYSEKDDDKRFKQGEIVFDKEDYHKVYNPKIDYQPYRTALRTWAGLYKRDFLDKYSIRHNETPGGSYQDAGFFVKTLYYAERVYFSDVPFYMWRQDNMSSSMHYDAKKVVEKSFNEWRLNKKYLDKNNLNKRAYAGFRYRQYLSYRWTLEMAAPSDKKNVFKIIRKEMIKANKKKEIDRDFFYPWEWEEFQELIKNPKKYFLRFSIQQKKRKSGFKSKIKKILHPLAAFSQKLVYKLFGRVSTELLNQANRMAFRTEEAVNHEIAVTENKIDAVASQLLEKINQVDSALEGKIDTIEKNWDNNKIFIDFLKDCWVSDMIVEKKIFLVGTPEHSNIGDAAIAVGEYEFIKKYFPQYKIVEIQLLQLEWKYQIMRSIINNDDLIFLQGGGNLGNLYLHEEELRRKIIADYPNNKIVIMPQSIYFTNDKDGERERKISAEAYSRHKDLTLFVRGLESLEFAKEFFYNTRCMDALDLALMLKGDFEYERKGILLCIKDLTDESGLSENLHEEIKRTVEKFDSSFETSKNYYVNYDIYQGIRRMVVDEELKKFSRHKLVVTDRLHGLIFSVVTKTPCVLIGGYYQKQAEFVKNFMDSSAVFFIDKDISKLEDAIQKAMLVTDVVYPVMEQKPFDKMYEYIIWERN